MDRKTAGAHGAITASKDCAQPVAKRRRQEPALCEVEGVERPYIRVKHNLKAEGWATPLFHPIGDASSDPRLRCAKDRPPGCDPAATYKQSSRGHFADRAEKKRKQDPRPRIRKGNSAVHSLANADNECSHLGAGVAGAGVAGAADNWSGDSQHRTLFRL
jgi:hypothetical protein